MEKIQEAHGKLFMHEQNVGEYMKAHATITEDLMGRFAEWVAKEDWICMVDKTWYKRGQSLTTSELIQLFKETL